MDATRTQRSSLVLSNFTSAMGFALGELLHLTRTPYDLPEYLREIHVTARATIMCAHGETSVILRPGVSLSDAALKAVAAWSADPHDLAGLDDAMAVLSQILEEMGMLRMVEG